MIQIKNLTKYFGKTKVLDNLSFEIQEGKITGFIGDNGAGKSTTMKILATSITEYEGEIEIFGSKLHENIIESREIIGFMPDQYGLYQDLSVTEYLEFFLQAYEKEIDHKKIDTILQKLHLEDKKHSIMKGLSRGMTQRVLLAKALITEPKFLILDEPASGLDPKLRLVLKNILHDLKKTGVTIFVSSHILGELEAMVDNLVIIDQGEIVYQGTIKDFQKHGNKKEIYIHTTSDEEIPNIFQNGEIILLEKGVLLKNFEDSGEVLQTLLNHNFEIIEYKNNIQDIETAYISLTNK